MNSNSNNNLFEAKIERKWINNEWWKWNSVDNNNKWKVFDSILFFVYYFDNQEKRKKHIYSTIENIVSNSAATHYQ